MVDERIDYIDSPRRRASTVQRSTAGPCACCFSCCRRSQPTVSPADGSVIALLSVDSTNQSINQSVSQSVLDAVQRSLQRYMLRVKVK